MPHTDEDPFRIRTGTIAEALHVEASIPEFGTAYEAAKYAERFEGRPHLILVAEMSDALVGYKVGYEKDQDVFYSWLGGVTPEVRGRGVATLLRERQEAWARSHGYRRLRVKSKNRFPHMLRLLIGAGYQIIGTEGIGDDLKIVFELELRP